MNTRVEEVGEKEEERAREAADPGISQVVPWLLPDPPPPGSECEK